MTLQFTPGVDLFDDLQNEMDRVFGGLFRNRAAGATRRGAYPTVNLWEDEDAYHVEAELPGVSQKDLAIDVEDGELTIHGERQPVGGDGNRTIHQERQRGSFTRKIKLAKDVDVEHAEASLQDGVLALRLPKAAAARPRRIEIR